MLHIERWPYTARALLFVLLALVLTGLMSRSEMFKRVGDEWQLESGARVEPAPTA